MWIQEKYPYIIDLGCAHARAINTIDYITEITGTGTFYAVLGEMHLLQASTDRIHATIECLKRYDVQLIGANHCTGMKAVSTLWCEFGDRCVDCRTGTQLIIGRQAG